MKPFGKSEGKKKRCINIIYCSGYGGTEGPLVSAIWDYSRSSLRPKRTGCQQVSRTLSKIVTDCCNDSCNAIVRSGPNETFRSRSIFIHIFLCVCVTPFQSVRLLSENGKKNARTRPTFCLVIRRPCTFQTYLSTRVIRDRVFGCIWLWFVHHPLQ